MYLALESGLPSFPQDFACLMVLRILAGSTQVVRYGTFTRSGSAFQPLRVTRETVLRVLQPQPFLRSAGLGSSRFARHYSGNLG